VTVGRRIGTFSNAALYECYASEPIAKELRVPASGVLEVSGLEWVDPTALEAGDWRFEDRFATILAAVKK